MGEVILYSSVLSFMSIACSIKLRMASGTILIITFIWKGIQQNYGDSIENYVQIINTNNGGNIWNKNKTDLKLQSRPTLEPSPHWTNGVCVGVLRTSPQWQYLYGLVDVWTDWLFLI